MKLVRQVAQERSVKCELAAEVLRSTGKLRLQVTGWSMYPSVRPSDVLMIERAGREAVSEGDIVLFRRKSRFFVHRVVSKGAQIVTRGDAMTKPDDPVTEKELLGKVTFILRNGRCIEPRKTQGAAGQAVGALVGRSAIAARVVARVHALQQGPDIQTL
jgi:signal peptidase I